VLRELLALMRVSAVLLLAALAGVIGGAALIGTAALGAAVIFDSLCVGWWALQRDDGAGPARAERSPRRGIGRGRGMRERPPVTFSTGGRFAKSAMACRSTGG
jgi:hypothetical protein